MRRTKACSTSASGRWEKFGKASPTTAGETPDTQLETWLELELRVRFAGRILPIVAEVADRWGQLAADAKRKGRPLSAIDGLLAATALHRNLTIISRNVADFTNFQVPFLNPWVA